MRIQSNFKDYYDHLQQYVFGESSTYHRHWCDTVQHYDLHSSYYERAFFVGFCGTVYSGLVTYKEHYNEEAKRTDYLPQYHFDIESYDKRDGRLFRLTREDLRAKLSFFRVVKSDEIFIFENSPIILAVADRFSVCCPLTLKRQRSVQKVPSLQKIGFDQVVSDKEAYTQLTSYIDGFLNREHKSVPDMSDKIKRDSHGFSGMSFKNRSVN